MNISPRDEKIKKSAHKNKKKVGIFLRPLMEYPEIEEKEKRFYMCTEMSLSNILVS